MSERSWRHPRSHREYEAAGRGGSSAIKKSAPPPARHPLGCKATSLCGSNNRSRRRRQTPFGWFIRIHERQKSKIAVGSRVDEDIHIGTGFGFIAGVRSEEVQRSHPETPQGGFGFLQFCNDLLAAHVLNICQGA